MEKLILIAEDDKPIRMLLDMRIKKEKMQTILCENGENALDYLRSTKPKPDLIITDIMMPKLNGYQLCREIKLDEQLKKIPVLMLTAKREIKSKLTGFTLGADEYIYKPFDISNVINRVKALLERAEKPAPKIRYGQNNTVLFKLPNNLDGLTKIREIVIELTEMYALSKKTLQYIEDLFSELTDLILNANPDKLFYLKFAYFAESSTKIIMKMEIEEPEILEKLDNQIIEILKNKTSKFSKNNNSYIFEINFESLDDIIAGINTELKSTVSNVTDNIKQLKEIKELWQ
ncbi:MAG TPA: response regulator [bacterium]|nr:response regulator [bacterium]